MSVHIYPVTPSDLPLHDAYFVKVNGIPVTLDTARVSAFPFNRRWPGHQRSTDQTELVNFLNLAADEPVTFEITPKTPSDTVIIRPLSLGITPDISPDGKITFTLDHPAYFTVEPCGRQNALHIFCDPMPDYADVDINDPRTIYFGKGVHDAGEITLHDGETLFIDEGALVYGTVRAKEASNIRMLGRGILDASRHKEQILFEVNAENNDCAVNNAKRTVTVMFEYCTNVLVEGVTLRDSLTYNFRPVACENLSIRSVKLIGNWRYNSDGIDMHNCINTTIDNCFIRTYDDSICVKGFDCYYDGDVEEAVRQAMYYKGKAYDVFRSITVTNCTIWNDWGKALEIGAETRAEEIYDVHFEHCDVIHVTGPVLDCCNVDFADVHDIYYQHICVEFDDTIPMPLLQRTDAQTYTNDDPDFAPPLICAEVLYHHEYSAGGKRRGRNHDLTFEDIHVTGRQPLTVRMSGHNEAYQTADVLIKDVYKNGEKVREEDFLKGFNEYTANIRFE